MFRPESSVEKVFRSFWSWFRVKAHIECYVAWPRRAISKMSISTLSKRATYKMSNRVVSTFNKFSTFLQHCWFDHGKGLGRRTSSHQQNQSQWSSCQLTYSINPLRLYTFYLSTSSGVGDTEARTRANQHQMGKTTCDIATTTGPIANIFVPVETLCISVLSATIVLILSLWLLQ